MICTATDPVERLLRRIQILERENAALREQRDMYAENYDAWLMMAWVCEAAHEAETGEILRLRRQLNDVTTTRGQL